LLIFCESDNLKEKIKHLIFENISIHGYNSPKSLCEKKFFIIEELLEISVKNNIYVILKYILELEIPYYDRNKINNKLFVLASQKRDLNIIKFLFENGVTIDQVIFIPYLTEKSIIMELFEHGDLDIIKFLFKNGLTVNNFNKNLAFELSVKNRHFDILEFLFENGFTIDDVRNNNNNAFLYVASNKDLRYAKISF